MHQWMNKMPPSGVFAACALSAHVQIQSFRKIFSCQLDITQQNVPLSGRHVGVKCVCACVCVCVCVCARACVSGCVCVCVCVRNPFMVVQGILEHSFSLQWAKPHKWDAAS
ncbi:unnamed protein product [Effrenium voratum]|nr:unnamed protein product [Effrenium voratum]